MLITQAYETLWDNITKQFFKHSDAVVVEEGFKTIQTLMAATSLKATNTAKYDEFEESLVSTLRETIGDKDIASSPFDDEEVHAVESAFLRIKTVLLAKNISALILDEEADVEKVWDLALALAERGKLGYKEEAKVSLGTCERHRRRFRDGC